MAEWPAPDRRQMADGRWQMADGRVVAHSDGQVTLPDMFSMSDAIVPVVLAELAG